MLTGMELAILAIALAWLLLIVTIGVFYIKINRERREMNIVKEKISHTEESIKRITGFFLALKGGKSSI